MPTVPLYCLLALWLCASFAGTVGVFRVLRDLRPCPEASERLPVAIIAPVKNAGPYLAEFFRRLRAQHYTDARIMVVVESMEDPAYPLALVACRGPGLPMTVLVAGVSADRGQKIWNLCVGLEALSPTDEIAVFVDADILPGRDWLGRLVDPILRRTAEATSGYRWLIPFGSGWSSYLVAVSDQAVATTQRWRYWNVAWGGSCAIRREILDRLDLVTWWRGAVSDDAQLTRALWAIDRMVVCPPGLYIPSPVRHTLGSAFEFGRRQYVIVRTHIAIFWWVAAFAFTAPIAMSAIALASAAAGDFVSWTALLVVFMLAQARFFMRRRIERWLVREADVADPPTHPGRLWFAVFGGWIFHVFCMLSARSSRGITWAGVDYEILAPQRVRVGRR